MLRMPLCLHFGVCLLALAVTAQSRAEDILPAGTLLRCTLDEPNLTSRTVDLGDPVVCHVGAVFGRSIFPRGAYLAGHFQDYRDPGHFFGKGWIALTFDHFVSPGSVTLSVSAKTVAAPHLKVDREGRIRGHGHPKRDAIEWAIPILWPVKVLSLPGRGPLPALKGESCITLRLLDDMEVPATSASSGIASPLPGVRQLRPSGQDAKTRASWRDFRTDPSDRSAAAAASSAEGTRLVGASDLVDRPRSQVTVLILKDDIGHMVTDYWLEGTALHFLSRDGVYKIVPLVRLDLDETVRLNRERSVDVVLRFKEE